MKLRKSTLAWCVAGLVLAVSAVTRADDFKNFKPTGYVTDNAGVINAQTKTQLEALSTELEQKTGAQLAIVTVKSLDGQDVQTYANNLFQQFGIGKTKQDNGVMILVAPNDRKYWTEVGYGLEPIINDARAGDAGRLMTPYFRQGDYSSGISAAAWQLAKYIADDKGVVLTGAPDLPAVKKKEDSGIGIWIFLGIILFVILMSRSGGSGSNINRRGGTGGMGNAWWIGPIIGGGWGGSRGGWGSGGSGGGGWGGSGGGFGGFGGGSSGGGGAGGGW